MMFPTHQLKRQPRRTRRFRSVPLLASRHWQFTPFAALRMPWSPHSGYGGSAVPGETAAASVAAALREPLVVMAQGHPTGRAGNAARSAAAANAALTRAVLYRGQRALHHEDARSSDGGGGLNLRSGWWTYTTASSLQSQSRGQRVCVPYLILLEKPASVYPGRVISFIREFLRRVLPPSGKGGRRSAR